MKFLPDSCLEVEKMIFLEIHKFYTFYLKMFSRRNGVGVKKFTICCLLTQQMLHTKYDKVSSNTKNRGIKQIKILWREFTICCLLSQQMLHTKYG